MRLSSAQLEAFYAVARSGNFTKAAEAINVTQSALSQRILNLEAEIETTLFIRDRAGIALTDAAEELLRYCELQVQFESEFLGRLKAGNSKELVGVIRIAGFSSVMRSVILPGLKTLLTENPGVQLQIHTKELHELLPMLKRREVDFIVLDQVVVRDELEAHELGTESNVLVEPAKSKFRVPEVYLDHDEKDETTRKYLKLAKENKAKLTRHFLDDIYGILDGVSLGLGKAVLPKHLIQDRKDLKVKNPEIALKSPVVLHHFKQPFYSRMHQKVIAQLKTECPRLLTD